MAIPLVRPPFRGHRRWIDTPAEAWRPSLAQARQAMGDALFEAFDAATRGELARFRWSTRFGVAAGFANGLLGLVLGLDAESHGYELTDAGRAVCASRVAKLKAKLARAARKNARRTNKANATKRRAKLAIPHRPGSTSRARWSDL